MTKKPRASSLALLATVTVFATFTPLLSQQVSESDCDPTEVVRRAAQKTKGRSSRHEVTVSVDPSLQYTGDAEAGKQNFANYCASCHGPNGEGYALGVPGPGIGLPGFLNVASDDYIFQTLKHGRVGTPMKSFLGARGLANLADQDAYDLIAHLRVLQENPVATPVSSDSEFE